MELKKKAAFAGLLLFIAVYEVNGGELANGKTTDQSSTYPGGDAQNAVDGVLNPYWGGGSCTHTQKEAQPWWSVQLEREADVFGVKIVNRLDCCADRLHGAVVTVGNDPDPRNNAQCGPQVDMRSQTYEPMINFDCGGPMGGQYVGVYLREQTNMLTLCEVGVFGDLAEAAEPAPEPEPDQECYIKVDASDYRGAVHQTGGGIECQRWTKQYPHEHSRTEANFPGSGLGDHSNCRNPDGEPTAWCYTTDARMRWKFCDVGKPSDTCGTEPEPEQDVGYYGIGTDLKIYRRNTIDAAWELLPGSCCVTSMTTTPDGTIVGVGTSHNLWTRTATSGWSPVATSCCPVDVTYLNDGSILGTDGNGNLWHRPGIQAGGWYGPVKNSCCVKSVSQLSTGEIVGVGMDEKLYIRAGVEGVWSKVDDYGLVTDITITSDGKVVGIGDTCGLWQRQSLGGSWGNEIAGSRCVKSVSVIRE